MDSVIWRLQRLIIIQRFSFIVIVKRLLRAQDLSLMEQLLDVLKRHLRLKASLLSNEHASIHVLHED